MSASSASIKSCLNILRRTPPGDTEQNLAGLTALLNNDTAEELMQKVDPPLKDASDPLADGKPYLLCDYNRDGDSHRSPWSNTYNPLIGDGDDGFKPSDKLRELEIHANEVFDAYRELYYGRDAISSVYLWDQEDGASFAGCFLIKKAISSPDGSEHIKTGYWNSVHVVDVGAVSNGTATYKLTTTVLISMVPSDTKLRGTNIGGTLSRQTEKVCPVSDGGDNNANHLINIGQLIENMEIDMRSSMDSLYIQKTREVIESIRRMPASSLGEEKDDGAREHTRMLNEAILARRMNRNGS